MNLSSIAESLGATKPIVFFRKNQIGQISVDFFLSTGIENSEVVGYPNLENGIASLESKSHGNFFSAHPGIGLFCSVGGMNRQGYWGPDDVVTPGFGSYYNMSIVSISNTVEALCLYLESNPIEVYRINQCISELTHPNILKVELVPGKVMSLDTKLEHV